MRSLTTLKKYIKEFHHNRICQRIPDKGGKGGGETRARGENREGKEGREGRKDGGGRRGGEDEEDDEVEECFRGPE